ncbi:hypothetical protein AGMMS49938_11040 [Fibrobacterales bacterium]|nr:hypothetical protein AGMMS49938_11040 [Fibrobacterales bacterium]
MKQNKVPISFNIASTLHAIETVFDKNLQGSGIDIPSEAFGILLMAYFKKDMIQQNIADISKKDKSTVLRLINMLEKKKLVKREVNPLDKRANFIVATANGKKMARQIIRKEAELFGKLTKNIPQYKLNIFISVLLTLKLNAGTRLNETT